MNSTRAMRHRKWTSLIYLNKPAFWFSLPASWAIVIQCYSLLWCEGIAQGMLPKLIHPSYRIFIVVLLMTEPSSVNFGFRHKRGTFQQHLTTSARHVSPDKGTFLRPTMPTWSSGCLIHVKPYELTRCPFWKSCHWVAQIAIQYISKCWEPVKNLGALSPTHELRAFLEIFGCTGYGLDQMRRVQYRGNKYQEL